jgi:tetratricopeptide (TPR) repeat protein
MNDKNSILKALHENADMLFSKGELKQAVMKFEEIINIEPNDSNAWHNKGAVHFELEEFNQALRCFNKALMLYSDSSSLYMKALTLASLGWLMDAVACCDSALSVKGRELSMHSAAYNLRKDIMSDMAVDDLALYYRYYYQAQYNTGRA